MMISTSKKPRIQVNPPLIFGILLLASTSLAVGLLVALSSDLALRLLPLAVIAVAVLSGLLGRSEHQLSENIRVAWMTTLLSIMTVWPSYLLIKAGGLPALDARRIVAGLTIAYATYCVIAYRPITRALSSDNHGPLRTGCWIVSLYALWRLASCFASPAPIASLIHVAWEILYYYGLFFVGFLFFSSDTLRDKIQKLLLWLLLVVTAYACVERALSSNPLIQWAPSSEELAATVRSMNSSRIRDGAFRTQSTFEHPLLLAEFAAMASCYALAAILWPAKNGGDRWLGCIALGAGVLAAYLTGSRSALVSFGAGLGAVLLMRLIAPRYGKKGNSIRKWIALLAVPIALTLAVPAVLVLSEGKSAEEEGSTQGRVVMLKTGFKAIEAQPLLGWGPGTGAAIAGIKTGDGHATMDNYLLAIAIESGVPGFLLFLACLLFPAWTAFSNIALGANDAARFLAGTVGAMTAILVMRSILWMPFNLTFAFILAAVALAQCSKVINSGNKS